MSILKRREFKTCICGLSGYGHRIEPDVFAQRMRELYDIDSGDPENFHIEADSLMEETLRSLGYTEGVEIFEKMTKWYA